MKTDELLNNASFRNWANGVNEADCRKWEDYLNSHPKETEALLAARMMAVGKSFTAVKTGVEETGRSWASTLDGIRSYERSRSRRRWITYATVAASVALFAVTGFVLTRDSATETVWAVLQTAPGQIMEYQFNDGTMVTLNGNSELQYPEVFDLYHVREVKLSGEAFFQVSNHGEQAPFKVITKDAQVEVLGTVFNVKARKSSVVSLLEGKVEVTESAHGDQMLLHPGQTAAVQRGGMTVREDDVQSRASWRNQLWVFDETPLRDVAADLEESFGVATRFAPGVDTDKKISGKLSTENLTTLYRALETMLGIKITETGNGISIKNSME